MPDVSFQIQNLKNRLPRHQIYDRAEPCSIARYLAVSSFRHTRIITTYDKTSTFRLLSDLYGVPTALVITQTKCCRHVLWTETVSGSSSFYFRTCHKLRPPPTTKRAVCMAPADSALASSHFSCHLHAANISLLIPSPNTARLPQPEMQKRLKSIST